MKSARMFILAVAVLAGCQVARSGPPKGAAYAECPSCSRTVWLETCNNCRKILPTWSIQPAYNAIKCGNCEWMHQVLACPRCRAVVPVSRYQVKE